MRDILNHKMQSVLKARLIITIIC